MRMGLDRLQTAIHHRDLSMPLSFHKMHANGDDFMVVDARNSANPVTSALARRMGDRHRGIGFNQPRIGVLAIEHHCELIEADATIAIANAPSQGACHWIGLSLIHI